LTDEEKPIVKALPSGDNASGVSFDVPPIERIIPLKLGLIANLAFVLGDELVRFVLVDDFAQRDYRLGSVELGLVANAGQVPEIVGDPEKSQKSPNEQPKP